MDYFLDFRPSPGEHPAQRRLRAAESLLACYQAALGHDLPNHLLALQALARLLEEGQRARLDEEGRALAARLAALAQEVDARVRRLAEVGRMCRAATASGDRAPLAEVAREAAAAVNLMSRGRPVEYHLPRDLPLLPVGREALHEVLVQLFRNAAEAAVEGQPLVVEVGGRGGEFWVRDDGRGLTDAQADRLSQQLAGAAPPAAGRLGLFLVREVVARWGGSLRVQSEPGRGTTVTISLSAG